MAMILDGFRTLGRKLVSKETEGDVRTRIDKSVSDIFKKYGVDNPNVFQYAFLQAREDANSARRKGIHVTDDGLLNAISRIARANGGLEKLIAEKVAEIKSGPAGMKFE